MMDVSKLASEELQEKLDQVELPGEPFFCADEDFMQKAVKMICTNYDLD
jgi:hypothetical protein